MATGAEVDDIALVESIARGDDAARDAEGALCRRFAPRIRLYGLRHLSTADAANDLVQIVLLGVLEAARAGRLREPEHLERFILGVCRNASLRLRQRDGRAVPIERERIETMLASVAPPEPVDERALSRCLDGLEERARAVLVLAYREDRSAEDIAGALGV